MTTEEKNNHYEMLDEIVKNRVSPMFWMVGIAVTLFGIVFGIFAIVLIDVARANGTKATIEQVEVVKKDINNQMDILRQERSKDYLRKLDYYQIEVREHTKIKEAFENPKNAVYVLQEINERIQFDLGLQFINSTPIR